MKAFFLSMLSDNTDGISATRCVMVAWFAVMFTAWGVSAIIHGNLPEIPSSVQIFSASVLAAKVMQRTQETVATTEVDGSTSTSERIG